MLSTDAIIRIQALALNEKSCNLVFETKGTFNLQQDWTLDERFDAAMSFACSKGLCNSQMLHAEVPMSAERINTLYELANTSHGRHRH